MRENFPNIDIEPRIHFTEGLIVNNYISKMQCIPWTVGKATLMGDACHTQGPEGGLGLNLNYEIARSYIKILKDKNGNFAAAGKEIDERFQAQGKAGTDIQQLKKAGIRPPPEVAPMMAAGMMTTIYLCKNYPDKMVLFDDLLHLSTIPHQDIMKYIGIQKQIV